jgi:hypothetical protein
MRNLAIFGGVALRALVAKKLSDAETKLTFVAGEKTHVIIAWQGAPIDGHTGVLEGKNEQGKSLVRLDATGGVFAVPGEFLVAAPKAKAKTKEEAGAEARKPNPGSRGSAPQEEEMTKRAKEDVNEIVEPPKKLETSKPKSVAIEQARTAPQAGSAIETIVDKLNSIANEKAAAVSQLNKFEETLNIELIDQHYLKTVKELRDAVVAKGEPVLQLKDKFLAATVKRDVVQANMSEETTKKFNAFLAALDKKEQEMAKINEQMAELINASFARMGGTEKVEEHINMFEDKNKAKIAPASLIAMLSATTKKDSKFLRLEAGLKEMFKAMVESAKEFASGIAELVGLGNSFLSSYEKDAKAADKAEPVTASKVQAISFTTTPVTNLQEAKAAIDGGEHPIAVIKELKEHGYTKEALDIALEYMPDSVRERERTPMKPFKRDTAA